MRSAERAAENLIILKRASRHYFHKERESVLQDYANKLARFERAAVIRGINTLLHRPGMGAQCGGRFFPALETIIECIQSPGELEPSKEETERTRFRARGMSLLIARQRFNEVAGMSDQERLDYCERVGREEK